MAKFLNKISFRDVRNVILNVTIVFGGLGLALVTLWAHQTANPRLAGAAALASLVFVVLILLFVVPPLAIRASREVAQIDVPLELTSGGLIFLGIIAIVGFASWNTGNNLLFLVLSFLLATLAVSFLVGKTNLKKLEARVRFPEAIFAGESTVFSVGIKNHKRLFPSFSVALALRGATTDDPFGGREFRFIRPPVFLASLLRLPLIKRTIGYFIFVARRGEAEQQTEQSFSGRGRFIIKDFELSTKFPFGFWQQRRRLRVRETEIFVFPQLIKLNSIISLVSAQNGQFTTARRGFDANLIGLREYQPSDDMRHVDWKATARVGNLTTREFAAENERRISIVFDNQLPLKDKTETKERFERGVSLTASIIAYFVNSKAHVQLVVGGEASNFEVDKAHLYELLRRLCTIEPVFVEEPGQEKTVLASQNSATTILIAPYEKEFNPAIATKIVSY